MHTTEKGLVFSEHREHLKCGVALSTICYAMFGLPIPTDILQIETPSGNYIPREKNR